MKSNVYVINGPNLNLLGKREPDIYGSDTLADVASLCHAEAQAQRLTVTFLQSNHEGQIIDWIHEARESAAAIIINAGGYSHTSIAILDALNAFKGPVIEVHISNVHKREDFRQHSFISGRADGVIVGCGVQGYALALARVAQLTKG